MYNELKTKDDAWMQSVHERIDRLSAMIDGISRDGAVPPKEDVYLCDKEVACMLKSQPQNTGRVPEQRHAALLRPRRQGLVQEERDRAGVGTGIQVCGQDAGKREDFIYLFFYALVPYAGIKTVRIRPGRFRAPATDCFL